MSNLGVVARIVRTQIQHKCRILPRLQKRYASNFKRPVLHKLQSDHMQELQMKMVQHGHDISSEEWQQTRDTLISNYRHINGNNVDAVILGLCNDGDQLKAAKSYVDHLRKLRQQPNLATLGRLLRVYYLKYQSSGVISLSAEEQQEIMAIYKDIREKHDFLDATTCENLIHGIVATDNWLDGLELLNMIKLSATPSVAAYNLLIVKAFHMADMEMGWGLLNEMMQERRHPKCDVFMTYLKTIAKEEKTFVHKFEVLLDFIGKHEIIITSAVCQHISILAEQMPHLLQVATTQLNRFGKCSTCNNHMQNVSVTDEEFRQLSESFLNKVLIRKDVFQKSTPEEVERFKKYIVDTGPYDCVIDGLNVAYSMGPKKSPSFLANLLASVVKYFNSNNKHILILGRKHMSKWPKDSMSYIKNNARVFLTNDLSQDDPFLLYATIKSGQSTDFFSRDLMRSHAYLLGPELKTIFKRWQQEHQYSLVTQTHSGKLIIKEPTRHMIYAHKVKSTWHIPSKLEYSSNPSENFEVPENWLCVNIQKI